ncbi:MAG: anthranilate phosphoribosyltransferase [Clostridiales bacterium]|jgi:anthranilate phosphoribosyltransferase|nr:anthranilate phosphoribosyltransferase [Clostridiales bacterium]
MIKEAIRLISQGQNLSQEQAYAAINQIMEGQASEIEIAAFITGLRVKGETAAELTGGVKALSAAAINIRPDVSFCVDPVGTGGDGTGTINISSAAALTASAAGACVAKHGNRSVSSSCGSADFFEELGLDLSLEPHEVEKCIETHGFGFMYAPVFHPAMRFAAPVRRHLGIRTIFNMLGPLTNPAGASGQVLGVYDYSVMPFVADTLCNLGIKHAMVVHGSDHSDEITISGETAVIEIKNGKKTEYTITPENFGLSRSSLSEVGGSTPEDNANKIMEIFQGRKNASRDMILLNAAASIYVGQAADSFEEGLSLAVQAIDQGLVLDKIQKLRSFRHVARKDA